jgi:hypothetical protein
MRERLPVRRALCLRSRQAQARAHQPAAHRRASDGSGPGRRRLVAGRPGRYLLAQDAQASKEWGLRCALACEPCPARQARARRPAPAHTRTAAGRPPAAAGRSSAERTPRGALGAVASKGPRWRPPSQKSAQDAKWGPGGEGACASTACTAAGRPPAGAGRSSAERTPRGALGAVVAEGPCWRPPSQMCAQDRSDWAGQERVLALAQLACPANVCPGGQRSSRCSGRVPAHSARLILQRVFAHGRRQAACSCRPLERGEGAARRARRFRNQGVLAGARPPRTAPRTAQTGAREETVLAAPELTCPADVCSGGQRPGARPGEQPARSLPAVHYGDPASPLRPAARRRRHACHGVAERKTAARRAGIMARLGRELGSCFGAPWSGRRRGARRACVALLREGAAQASALVLPFKAEQPFFFLHARPPHAALRPPPNQAPHTCHSRQDRRPPTQLPRA